MNSLMNRLIDPWRWKNLRKTLLLNLAVFIAGAAILTLLSVYFPASH